MATLYHEIRIDAPPERVYEALTTTEGLRGWWTPDASAEPIVGSIAVFGFYNRAVVFRMRIDALRPNRRVDWTCVGDYESWLNTRISWQLKKVDGGTLTKFRHAGWPSVRGTFAETNTTWGALMYHLKSYCEGNAPGPFFKE